MKKQKTKAKTAYVPGDTQAYTLIDLFVEGIKILNDGILPLPDNWSKHLKDSLLSSRRGPRKNRLKQDEKILIVNAAIEQKNNARTNNKRASLKDIIPNKKPEHILPGKEIKTTNIHRDMRVYGEAALKRNEDKKTSDRMPSDKEIVMSWMDVARQFGIRPIPIPKKDNNPNS